MQKFLIFLCLLLSSIAKARFFTINNKTIEYLKPTGFVEITTQINTIYKLTRHLATNATELLACYIIEADLIIAKAEKSAEMEHIFYILLNKKSKTQKNQT